MCEEQPCSPLPVNNSRQDPCYAPVTSHAASRMTLADVMKNGESGLDDSLGRVFFFCDKEFLRHLNVLFGGLHGSAFSFPLILSKIQFFRTSRVLCTIQIPFLYHSNHIISYGILDNVKRYTISSGLPEYYVLYHAQYLTYTTLTTFKISNQPLGA